MVQNVIFPPYIETIIIVLSNIIKIKRRRVYCDVFR